MKQELNRLMVIEDDALDFSFLKTAFESLSVPVELFNWPSVEGAVGRIIETACSMVVVDLNLRDGNGTDIIRQIRSHDRLSRILVIAFSSSLSDRDLDACYSAGANAYVEKPLSMEKYRKFAQAFNTFWLETAALPGKR